MRAPWWLCFGWRPKSALCAADTFGHSLIRYLLPPGWRSRAILALDPLCERHDRNLIARESK